jgi:hypothetical protein
MMEGVTDVVVAGAGAIVVAIAATVGASMNPATKVVVIARSQLRFWGVLLALK